MPEEIIANFRSEGEPAFPTEETAETTATESQPENNQMGTTPSSEGENNTQMTKQELPFNKDPRIEDYVERRVQKSIDEFKKTYANDISEIQKKFSTAREANAQQEEIPEWFGGDQRQWDQYRAHEDQRLKQAEERAYERIKKERDQEEARVKEANTFFQSELQAIESDKTLNPNGLKIDPNRLLKTAEDFDLIDSKGRWNYRAAWRILENQMASEKGGSTPQNRKQFAGATTSESRPETSPRPFKTSADFKKNRPW